MADITAGMVKDLRERTGLGMMECKKALVEANGDIELAIEELRKSSGMKAAKKAGPVRKALVKMMAATLEVVQDVRESVGHAILGDTPPAAPAEETSSENTTTNEASEERQPQG